MVVVAVLLGAGDVGKPVRKILGGGGALAIAEPPAIAILSIARAPVNICLYDVRFRSRWISEMRLDKGLPVRRRTSAVSYLRPPWRQRVLFLRQTNRQNGPAQHLKSGATDRRPPWQLWHLYHHRTNLRICLARPLTPMAGALGLRPPSPRRRLSRRRTSRQSSPVQRRNPAAGRASGIPCWTGWGWPPGGSHIGLVRPFYATVRCISIHLHVRVLMHVI